MASESADVGAGERRSSSAEVVLVEEGPDPLVDLRPVLDQGSVAPALQDLDLRIGQACGHFLAAMQRREVVLPTGHHQRWRVNVGECVREVVVGEQ